MRRGQGERLARRRGAEIYAEVVGFGSSQDAFRLTDTNPEARGVASCIHKALDSARLNPEDIDYINAHGTSTPLGDKAETQAIKAVFGDHAHKMKLSSTKGALGHSLGASGGIEAVISCKTIQDSLIAPTINYSTPDPDCDLDYTPNQAAKCEVNVAMSNSFGFGGHNACILFRKYS